MNRQIISTQARRSIINTRKPCAVLATALIAMLALTTGHAATISDTPSVLDYDAGFNEVNTIEIKPNIVSGNPVLDIRDFAGLSGCTPFPTGSVISIRCAAGDLVFFPMQLDNQNDTLVVNETVATLGGYQLSVQAGLGDDDLTGGIEEDQFFGGSGSDFLNGEGGIDALYGEAGDDDLLGGNGTDQLCGGSGGDRIHAVDGTRDTIDCGLGRDIVRADPFDSIDDNCESVTLISL